MATLEVRRHAERADRGDDGSALSPAGRAMAERLASAAPRFAVVVSSPLLRARETATIIGGRLDATDPELLPDLALVLEAATIEQHADLVAGGGTERDIAEQQVRAWSRIATAAGDGAALAITHGGVIELGGLAIASGLRVRLQGRAFSYCEGLRITYDRGRATAMEMLRV